MQSKWVQRAMRPAALVVVGGCLTLTACGDSGGIDRPRGAAAEWTAFGGSPGGGHYSLANEITPQNVHALRLAWVHRSGDFRGPPASGSGMVNGPPQQSDFEVTPIVSDGTLYYCSNYNRVFALDAASGKQRSTIPVDGAGRTWRCAAACRCGRAVARPVRRAHLHRHADGRLIALTRPRANLSGFGADGTVDLSVRLSPRRRNTASPTAGDPAMP
jgi:quinoprotein glucose dehydrogenase